MAIVEAGLGAAKDATNALDASALELGVVTSIGPEHVNALGGVWRASRRQRLQCSRRGSLG